MMFKHVVKLLSAMLLGLMFSYFVYRLLYPVESFLASMLFLGFLITAPFTLILVFYGRLRWAMYFFASIWLAYLSALWVYMLVSVTMPLPSYLWAAFLLGVSGGTVLLFIFLRRRGVSLPGIPRKLGEVEEVEKQEEEEAFERPETSSFELQPSGERLELSPVVELLDEIHCRILMTLLESGRPYSKKELHEAIRATYPRTLRAIRELEKHGLVEVKTLPRAAKGAPVLHAVKASRSVLGQAEHAKSLLRRRMEELRSMEGTRLRRV